MIVLFFLENISRILLGNYEVVYNFVWLSCNGGLYLKLNHELNKTT